MKRSMKIISLIMAIVLLCGSLVSCRAIKLMFSNDKEKAIYFYELCQDEAIKVSSGKIEKSTTITVKGDEEDDRFVYKTETIKNNYGSKDMKYLVNVEATGGGNRDVYSYGFSDGKMFTSKEKRKIYTEMAASDAIKYIEGIKDEPDFEINVENCTTPTYTKKDDGGYVVELKEFSAEAIVAISEWLAGKVGVDRSSVAVNSYVITAEMDKKYMPSTVKIEIEGFLYHTVPGESRVLKANTEIKYSEMGTEVTLETPNIDGYLAVPDLGILDRIDAAQKKLYVSDFGDLSTKVTEKHIYTSKTESYESDTKTKYNKLSGNWSFSSKTNITAYGETLSFSEGYLDGTLTLRVGSASQKLEASVAEAKEYLQGIKESYFIYNRWIGIMSTYEVKSDKDTTTVVFNVDPNSINLDDYFVVGGYKKSDYKSFTLTVVLDNNDNIVSEEVNLKIKTVQYEVEFLVIQNISYSFEE